MSGKVIVTGSREWIAVEVIERALTEAGARFVIEGGARGADAIARRWAAANGVLRVTHRAEWEKYGRRAGALRNVQMLEMYPEALVLAFPLGGPGTRHCIAEAERRGMALRVYAPDGNLVHSTGEQLTLKPPKAT